MMSGFPAGLHEYQDDAEPAPSSTPAALAMAQWTEGAATSTKCAAKSKTISNSRMEVAAREVGVMLKTGDWQNARSIHFVALYVWLHKHTYGTEPLELTPACRLHCAGLVVRILEQHFRDDPGALADFVRWVWAREIGRKRANPDKPTTWRIGWRQQFSAGYLLTDYRTHLAQTGEL